MSSLFHFTFIYEGASHKQAFTFCLRSARRKTCYRLVVSFYSKCFLAQPAAASAAERNWSIYGLIKSDRRTRLRPVVADKLVYCHEALALHARLQDAAYRPVAEPWDEDSDEDSDNSDEGDEDSEILRLMV